jgi:hypothetical protein
MTEPIQEVQALKSFLGSLFGKVTAKKVEISSVSTSQLEKQAKDIIQKTIANFDAKTRKVERKRSAESIILRYHVSIGSDRYVLKGFVNMESRFFNLSLWSGGQERMLDILAVGDIKYRYRLRAMAKIRLKPWAESKRK